MESVDTATSDSDAPSSNVWLPLLRAPRLVAEDREGARVGRVFGSTTALLAAAVLALVILRDPAGISWTYAAVGAVAVTLGGLLDIPIGSVEMSLMEPSILLTIALGSPSSAAAALLLSAAFEWVVPGRSRTWARRGSEGTLVMTALAIVGAMMLGSAGPSRLELELVLVGAFAGILINDCVYFPVVRLLLHGEHVRGERVQLLFATAIGACISLPLTLLVALAMQTSSWSMLLLLPPIVPFRLVREQRLRLARAEADASTDHLTGLLNRRAGRAAAVAALNECREIDRPVWLMLLDLDHFKRINDEFGHHVGDAVLRATGDAIRDSCGERKHSAARWGGEEFLVVLSDVDDMDARRVAEQLRYDLERALAAWSGSVSVGLSAARRADRLDGALEDADRALYEAKNAGRNRVRASA